MVFSLDNIFIYGTISPIICDVLYIVTKYSMKEMWPKSYFSEMAVGLGAILKLLFCIDNCINWILL